MTSHKVRTNVYLDAEIKEQAKKIFKKYGVSLNDAINIFLAQSVLQKKLPFELNTPNEETIRAIEDAKKGINVEIVTIEDLKSEARTCL